MVLLDLSAAFDTMDHAIYLERLRFCYGFSNLVLQWLTSYLVERPQRILLDKLSSQPRRLSCGVPQGFPQGFGPVLFSLYISPLEDVITAHCLNAMIYADDSQLHIIVRQSNRATALKDLTLCIEDIMSWNVSNMLKCNPKKTDPSQSLHQSSRMTNPLRSNIAPQLTLLNRDIKLFLMMFIVRIGKQFMVNSIHQTFTRCKMRFQAPCYYC